jgi:hypothetical protein
VSGTPTAQCRFEWKLTSRALPFLVRGQGAGRNSKRIFGAVKGGRSPAQRTLDGIEKTFTLKGLGLDAGFASGPRARPAARTSPPSGAGESTRLGSSRIRRRVNFHSNRHSATPTTFPASPNGVRVISYAARNEPKGSRSLPSMKKQKISTMEMDYIV